jgi:hypothetical protein
MRAAPNGPTRRVSLEQATEQLRAIVHDVARLGPVELTEGSEPVAVIVAPGEYNRLAPERPSFWEALQKFRAETDLEELDIDSVALGRTPPFVDGQIAAMLLRDD